MLNKLKNNIVDMVFPPQCAACGRVGSFICDDCEAEIVKLQAQHCPFCNRITKNGKLCSTCRPKHHLTGVVAFGYFKDEVLKEAIHQYKYEKYFALSETLTQYLIEVIQANNLQFDLVAFAPISKKRQRERGYNQAQLLAEALAVRLGKPTFTGLKKARHTKTQVGLKRKDRIKNLAGAFVVTGSEVRGKRVLLIDDVLTTGTTLDECARALRAAGAVRVWGAVLARE